MNYSIQSLDAHKIAGFHMVGPWEQTVKQGLNNWRRGSVTTRCLRRSGSRFIMIIRSRYLRKNCVVTPLLPWRMITSSRRIVKGSSSPQLPVAITPAPARGSLTMISPRRGCSSLTACCRAASSKSRISPVLKFILTMATRMVTGILRCMWR